MFNTILVAVDGSENSMRAVEAAAGMARLHEAILLLLTVYRPVSPMENTHSLIKAREEVRQPTEALREFAKEVVDTAAAEARKKGAGRVETYIKKGQPARAIVEFAKDKKVDCIVVGSRGLGDVGGFLLGSVSHKVSSLAECTCIIIK